MKKMMKLTVSVLAASSLLVACGQTTSTEDTAASQETVEESQPSSSAEPASDSAADETTETTESTADQPAEQQGLESIPTAVDVETAVATFEETFEGASVSSISLSYEGGILAYDLDGFDEANEYDLIIDADNGQVLSQSQEAEDDGDLDEQAIDFSSLVTAQVAMEAAIGSAGGGSVEEWTLHVEDGLVIYEIELLDESNQAVDEVAVDAQSGEIIAQD